MQPEDKVGLPANLLRASGVFNILIALIFLAMSLASVLMTLLGSGFMLFAEDGLVTAVFYIVMMVVRVIPGILLALVQAGAGWWIFQTGLSLDLLDDRNRIQMGAIAAVAVPLVAGALHVGVSIVTINFAGCCTTFFPMTPVVVIGIITALMVFSVLSDPDVSKALDAV